MSGNVIIPSHYLPKLDLLETQVAIKTAKDLFEAQLADAMNLTRVSAPLFVRPETGLNDDLNGVERPVQFDILDIGGAQVQIVQSLAKWKRMALSAYGFAPGTGLYTDMNAIRRDEELDNLHSVYVDQWDWEKIIAPRDRCLDYLQTTVRSIADALRETESTIRAAFPVLNALPQLPREVSFITTQELEDLYPDLESKDREHAYLKGHPLTFLIGIGAPLKSGRPHDGRAPDYDDWTLNGDLLVWDSVLGCALELSSMGIRVDPAAMDRQLTASGHDERRALEFHRMLLAGELPLTIGGGIGQSRLCMYLLGKAHIGEVQAGIWDRETLDICQAAGVILL